MRAELVFHALEQLPRALACRSQLSSGAMPNSTMWSVFKPRSTRLTLKRLFANRPAGTSSAIDIAICTVASVVRKRRAALAPPGCPAWFFSVAARSGRVLCSAGNKPNAMPVRIAAPPANISIVGLSENANIAAPSSGTIDAIRSSVHFATNSPAIAPSVASMTDSVSSCVIN